MIYSSRTCPPCSRMYRAAVASASSSRRPYEPLKTYADAHGFGGLLDRLSVAADSDVARSQRILDAHGIASLLRHMNDPRQITNGNEFYRSRSPHWIGQ